MTKEMDLLVHTLSTFPEMNNPIKMEVGIEECLHIEFEYNKSKYDSINKYSRYLMHFKVSENASILLIITNYHL